MYSIPLGLRFCQETSLQEENFQATVWWAILVPFNHLVKNSQTTAAAVSSKIQNFIPLSLLGSLTPCLLVCSGALQPTLQYWKVSPTSPSAGMEEDLWNPVFSWQRNNFLLLVTHAAICLWWFLSGENLTHYTEGPIYKKSLTTHAFQNRILLPQGKCQVGI